MIVIRFATSICSWAAELALASRLYWICVICRTQVSVEFDWCAVVYRNFLESLIRWEALRGTIFPSRVVRSAMSLKPWRNKKRFWFAWGWFDGRLVCFNFDL